MGWHVARTLTERGYNVRALCRPASQIRELDAERVRPAILRDRISDRAPWWDVTVFHVAADYRLWTKNPQDLYARTWTERAMLLEAAAAARVERVVYTSTVGLHRHAEGSSRR